MTHVLLLLSALLIEAPSARAAEVIVFSGRPGSTVSSSADSSTRTVISESKRDEFKLLIARVGQEYQWASRGGRPLQYHMSGAFHVFTDPSGGGIIKILDSNFLPKVDRPTGPRFQYFETMSIWLGTVTYWGASDSLEL